MGHPDSATSLTKRRPSWWHSVRSSSLRVESTPAGDSSHREPWRAAPRSDKAGRGEGRLGDACRAPTPAVAFDPMALAPCHFPCHPPRNRHEKRRPEAAFLALVKGCRRRDSNPRHADYDGPHAGFWEFRRRLSGTVRSPEFRRKLRFGCAVGCAGPREAAKAIMIHPSHELLPQIGRSSARGIRRES